jgi:hypothetical protein
LLWILIDITSLKNATRAVYFTALDN